MGLGDPCGGCLILQWVGDFLNKVVLVLKHEDKQDPSDEAVTKDTPGRGKGVNTGTEGKQTMRDPPLNAVGVPGLPWESPTGFWQAAGPLRTHTPTPPDQGQRQCLLLFQFVQVTFRGYQGFGVLTSQSTFHQLLIKPREAVWSQALAGCCCAIS